MIWDENERLNLKDLRKKNHLTQGELADQIGVSKSTINAWESDYDKLLSASYISIMRLCEELNVRPCDLIDDDDWKM